MNTKQKLEQALKEAMKSGDSLQKNTLRLALASLKNAEIERRGQLEESAQIALIQKEIKMRQEAIEDAQRSARTDLAEKARQEISILEAYLPGQLGEGELRSIVEETIAEVDAAGPADMGRVMKAVMAKIQGKAPGDQVSRLVRERLQPG